VFDIGRILRQTFIRQIEYHSLLTSTNDFALRKLSNDRLTAYPWLLLADRQTGGRGREGRSWWSAPGALTFSLVLRFTPDVLPRADYPRLALTAGLAVYETIRDLAPHVPVGVKWPNDVHLDGRKVCGILIESPAMDPQFLVMGVGVNVNNTFANAPSQLQETAASLHDVGAPQSDVGDVLIKFLQHFERNVGLHAENPAAMVQQWSEACILTGKQVTIRIGRELTTGQCLGIDTKGQLRLRTGQGLCTLATGSIEHIQGTPS
jgi:BirA family biotin operon repressor/biotin-[acetyl-CoA-carboxylase] ligase